MCAKKSGQKVRFAKLRRRAERSVAKTMDGAAQHVEDNLVGKIHKIRDIRLHIIEWCLMLLAIIVLSLLQSVWFQDSYSENTFISGGSFVEGDLGEVDSLNPLFADTSSEKSLARLMFASLTSIDYSGHFGPDLAASVKADASGKVWTVRLRDNLRWSDGEPLTNSDVLFTVELIKNPRVSTTYSSNLSGVSVAEAENGDIVFTLPTAFADFAAALSFPILPEHILKDVDVLHLQDADFSSAPVSSGPFKFNATQVSPNGDSVVYLSANENYYGGTPLLDSFAVHAFATTEEIHAALTSGSITATAELQPDAIETASIYEKQTTISSGVYLFFNTTSPVFNNKTARRAVRKGINMESIREEVLQDEPALNYPILASQVNIKDWPALPETDEEAAQAYFRDKNEKISLVTVDTGYFPALMERIKGALENLGFEVEATAYSTEAISSVITARDYDLLIYEIELGADPDLFAYYHSSQTGANGLNLSNYNDAITDDLILTARSSISDSVRDEKYAAFLTRWVENCPAIGIYQVNLAYFLNTNVRAFSTDDTLVTATDRFTDVEYWSATKGMRYRSP